MADFSVGDEVPIQLWPSYTQPSTTIVTPGTAMVTVNDTSIYRVGMALLCDVDTANVETVTVSEINSSTTFTAVFTLSHGPKKWAITGGYIPSSVTSLTAVFGPRAGGQRVSGSATSQNDGEYAIYMATGSDFTADTYDPQLVYGGSVPSLSSVECSGTIIVIPRK